MSEEESENTSSTRSWLGRLGQALVGGEPSDRGELSKVLRDAHGRGLIDHDALQMIEGVLNVEEMRVDDVMIPRSQMVVVSRDDSPEVLIRVALESGHSRFPVVGDSRDEVVGILLAKDLLAFNSGASFNVRDLLRPPVFIPESKRLDTLLKEFRSSRNHMAMVVDEYGGVAGMVTIEDVLEQIVGDIEDEHDLEEELGIQPQGDNQYLLPALTPIDDFNRHFGSSFSDEEVDTIGGLVINGLGHLPKRGETYTTGGYSFRVQQADSRRIHALRLTIEIAENPDATPAPSAGGD